MVLLRSRSLTTANSSWADGLLGRFSQREVAPTCVTHSRARRRLFRGFFPKTCRKHAPVPASLFRQAGHGPDRRTAHARPGPGAKVRIGMGRAPAPSAPGAPKVSRE